MKTDPNIKLDKKPIIVFIPGIMGTRLKINSYDKDIRVWEPEADEVLIGIWSLSKREYLQCNSEGEPIHNSISTIDDDKGALDAYEEMMVYLKNNFASNYEILFFGYDWRLDNEITAKRLENRLRGYKDITIIAHSMGGIVSSCFINRSILNRNRVKKVINLGTPFLGSAKALYGLETGKILDYIPNLVIAGDIKKLMENYAPSFQLIPNYRYPYTILKVINLLKGEIKNCNYSETEEFLAKRKYSKDKDGNVKNIFKGRNKIHKKTEHNNLISETYYLIGTKSHTIKSLVYWDIGGKIDISYLEYADGDGTVIGESGRNGYISNYGKCFEFPNVEHGKLPKNLQVQNTIKAIINGEKTHSETVYHFNETGAKESVSLIFEGFPSIKIFDDEGNAIFEEKHGLYKKVDYSNVKIGEVWTLSKDKGKKQYVIDDCNVKFHLFNNQVNRDEKSILIFNKKKNKYDECKLYKEIKLDKDEIIVDLTKGAVYYDDKEILEPFKCLCEQEILDLNRS